MVVSFLKSVENYALQLDARTDARTDICHPHRNPQSEEIPYAALLSVYDDNKEKKYNTR